MAWVTNDGEYNGSSNIVEFDYDDLTPEQWENLENMVDYLRIDYVEAILAGRTDDVKSIEERGL
jgi:hypothetical protein